MTMHAIRFAATGLVVGLSLAAAGSAAATEQDPERIEALEARLELLLEQNARMQQEIRLLGGEVRTLRGGKPPAPSPAEASPPDEVLADTKSPESVPEPPAVSTSPPPSTVSSAPPESAIFSRQLGPANVQLLDISLDVLAAVGGSTASDDELELLQGGNHDPRQRGFTLQQVELSFMGAVDPFVNAEVHLLYFIDQEGESRFELEEAFMQTVSLPFGLHEAGFQVEAGQFFTEFGRINPVHPHAWDWQDQPFMLSRVFGEDGIRGPGVRIGWLLPLPWFSELNLGMQNAIGETMTSFLANDEVFEERPIGGRPFTDRTVRSLADFVYLIRSTHGFDLSDEVSAQLGGSVLLGPNATGNGGATQVYGGDLVMKWNPLDAERGWPFVKLQAEVLYRRYDADDFFGCFEDSPGCTEVALNGRTLNDLGMYAQALWGFERGWAAGLRYEYGGCSGADVAFDETTDAVVRVDCDDDAFRGTRHRVSPLLAWHPSEYFRLRLQYNYDHQRFLPERNQHSIWAGVEFTIGAHAAHDY